MKNKTRFIFAIVAFVMTLQMNCFYDEERGLPSEQVSLQQSSNSSPHDLNHEGNSGCASGYFLQKGLELTGTLCFATAVAITLNVVSDVDHAEGKDLTGFYTYVGLNLAAGSAFISANFTDYMRKVNDE